MPAAALDSAVLSFRKISLRIHTKSIVNNLTRWAEYIVVLMITFRLVQQRRTTSGENSCRQHNSNPELIGLANRAKPVQFRFQNSSIVRLKDRLFKLSQMMVNSRYKLQIIISVDLMLHSAFYAQGIAAMNLSLNPFVIHDVIPF